MMNKRQSLDPANDCCHICNAPMVWTEGLLSDGGVDPTTGKYGCPRCHTAAEMTESRAVKRGRALAHDLKGVPAMSRAITHFSGGTQIGILRERQHCKTCHNNMGDPCTCGGK